MDNIYRAWTEYNKTQNKLFKGPAANQVMTCIEDSVAQWKGQPYPKNEDWKYVKFKQLPTTHLHWPGSDSANRQVADETYITLEVNNFTNPMGFEKLALPKGIEVVPEIETKQPLSTIQDGSNPFQFFANSFYGLGFHINLTKEFAETRPIRLLFDLDKLEGKDLFIQQTVHVDVAPNVAAEIFLDVRGETFSGLTNLCFHIKGGKDAKVSFVSKEVGGPQSHYLLNLTAQVLSGGSFDTFDLTLPSNWSRHDIRVDLDETTATCDLRGVYLNGKKNFVDHHTTINHNVGDTHSFEDYRGILAGEAQAVFNGKVFIAEQARKSDSEQINKNLMLSKKAEVDTKPELQIYNDDVKAAHGATVGQIDEEQRFYLQSRGYSAEAARKVLAKAFIVGLLDEKSEANRQFLLTDMVGSLESLEENQ